MPGFPNRSVPLRPNGTLEDELVFDYDLKTNNSSYAPDKTCSMSCTILFESLS